MLNFGLIVILLLIIVSGVIAYIGDYIGRSIGRKRLRLLKLRPRYTAIIFTVITGVLIALTSVIIILTFSQDARVALFGLEELKGNLAATKQELAKNSAALSAIQAELKKGQVEKASLEKAKAKLTKEIEISRQGKVLFNVGETLMTSIIKAGPEKKKLTSGLQQLLSAADAYVRSLGVKKSGHLILLAPEEFASAVATLQKSTLENIVIVTAAENTLFGEPVPVHLKISESRLIYPAGTVISEISLPRSQSQPAIETEIKKLLYTTHQSAKTAGIVPGPSGSLGSVPYAEIISLAKKIKTYGKAVTIKTVAKKDIYPLDQLAVEFKVLYQ